MTYRPSSIEPLSVGNIVSAAIRLYGAKLKQYVPLGLFSSLWRIAPFLPLIVLVPIIIGLAGQEAWPLMVLVILLTVAIVVGLAIFCIAKALMYDALISRLAFSELVEKPETTDTVRDELRGRMFQFLLAAFLIGLLLNGISFVLQMAQNIVQGIFSVIFQDSLPALVALIGLVLALVSLAIMLWFQARWFVAELPVAVEQNVSGVDTVGRTWSLTQGFAWRIVIVIFVAFLVTLPLYAVALLPLVFGVFSIAAAAAGGGPPSPAVLGALLGSIGLSYLLFMAVSVFMVPFWQVIKSLVYLDLRTQREGMDLQLRDS